MSFSIRRFPSAKEQVKEGSDMLNFGQQDFFIENDFDNFLTINQRSSAETAIN